ncbi:hypothetical protein DFJ73DRAFT_70516 [Zopfochytrium polystomum]|nr:hypothetical protein DFJ73DRAFT_70516 [Zopfochytrium polystomum]
MESSLNQGARFLDEDELIIRPFLWSTSEENSVNGDEFCESEFGSEDGNSADSENEVDKLLAEEPPDEAVSKREIIEKLWMDEVIFPDLDETKDIAVVCDNVNSLKNCIQAMGPRVRACQDPFHLIWRSTSKVRKEAQRRLSKQFHEALYVSDRVLRGRSDMFYRVRALLDKFPKEEITSSFEKWTGTMNNTLFQIWRGDLSPVCGDNIHVENGKYRSVIQSSSNESLHSELAGLCRRSMSYNKQALTFFQGQFEASCEAQ